MVFVDMQNWFLQGIIQQQKLSHSTKFFIDSILTKVRAIHNGFGKNNNDDGSSTNSGTSGDSTC